jgi:hypothetical protein
MIQERFIELLIVKGSKNILNFMPDSERLVRLRDNRTKSKVVHPRTCNFLCTKVKKSYGSRNFICTKMDPLKES